MRRSPGWSRRCWKRRAISRLALAAFWLVTFPCRCRCRRRLFAVLHSDRRRIRDPDLWRDRIDDDRPDAVAGIFHQPRLAGRSAARWFCWRCCCCRSRSTTGCNAASSKARDDGDDASCRAPFSLPLAGRSGRGYSSRSAVAYPSLASPARGRNRAVAFRHKSPADAYADATLALQHCLARARLAFLYLPIVILVIYSFNARGWSRCGRLVAALVRRVFQRSRHAGAAG